MVPELTGTSDKRNRQKDTRLLLGDMLLCIESSQRACFF
jgi:hypothetical protein